MTISRSRTFPRRQSLRPSRGSKADSVQSRIVASKTQPMTGIIERMGADEDIRTRDLVQSRENLGTL